MAASGNQPGDQAGQGCFIHELNNKVLGPLRSSNRLGGGIPSTKSQDAGILMIAVVVVVVIVVVVRPFPYTGSLCHTPQSEIEMPLWRAAFHEGLLIFRRSPQAYALRF